MPMYYSIGSTYGSFVLNVRTKVRPESIFQPVRQTLSSIEPSLTFVEVHTLAQEVNSSESADRLTAELASLFGVVGVLLAGAGVYGLIAHSVLQRKREIGIRIALGARAADIRSLIGRQVLGIATGGVTLGIGALALAGPWVRSVVYGIAPWDPASLTASSVFVLLVAAGATSFPVRRAALFEPAQCLRSE